MDLKVKEEARGGVTGGNRLTLEEVTFAVLIEYKSKWV